MRITSDYLRVPAIHRLQYWKDRAAKPGHPDYRTWQSNARLMLGSRLKPEGWGAGYNGEGRTRKPVYVAFSALLPMQDAADVIRMRHTGWYTDTDGRGLAIGIVCKLPHARWLAGYRLTDNGEYVLYTDIYDSAEDERENAEQFQAAQELQAELSELEKQAGQAFALRNHRSYREDSRHELPRFIRRIRFIREQLNRDYKDYI